MLEEAKYCVNLANPHVIDLCQPLHQSFCINDRQQISIYYAHYRRFGPLLFESLRGLVARRKKLR